MFSVTIKYYLALEHFLYIEIGLGIYSLHPCSGSLASSTLLLLMYGMVQSLYVLGMIGDVIPVAIFKKKRSQIV